MSENGKMRLTLVTLGITLASVAVVGNAFYQKKQFYPSIVFLTKSNPSVAVLYAQAFVAVFLFGKAMRKIFFGQLRAAEVEHLIEKFWYVITETCLAFTVFRDDFSPKFVGLFTFLLFMKAFHWLVEDRVDYMERSPIIRVIFHLRVCSLLSILGTIDSVLIHHAFKTTVASGASVQMVFGFEYAILLTMVIATLMKYSLHVVDYTLDHPWENRNVYLLYGELITGFVKCCLYMVFVVVMVKIHTFPLFAIRPMYLTIRGFKKSLSDVILSRRAIAYMNTRFPDISAEELTRLDITTCIICRDRMVVGKKLPCSHIFHTHCLRSWFQRQQSCPTCRLDVLSPRPATQTAQQQQPQQQQNPQAPQVPPQVPGFMNMPPPFGMFPPQMPQQPPPADPSVTEGAASTATPTASSSFSNTMFNMNQMPGSPFAPNPFGGSPFTSGMPNMFVPPPMAGMPFSSLHPPMFSGMNLNVDMSTLSVEQLQEMEGQERENVEARIRVLRNVHSLLDTVILQLNQYSNIINSLNAMNPPSSTTTTTVASSTQQPAPNVITETSTLTTNSTDTVMSTSVTPEANATNKNNIQTPSSSSTDNSVVENIEFSENAGSSSSSAVNSTLIGDLSNSENDLRRRRLERFESVNKNKDNENDATE